MKQITAGSVSPLRVHTMPEHGFWNAAVPTRCIVPVQQHVGSRLDLLVDVGDHVREGMVLAESPSRLGVPLHAPIPGRVTAIGTSTLLDGTTSRAIEIELDGEFDRLGKKPEPESWHETAPDELLAMVQTAGVVCGPRERVPAHLVLRSNRRLGEPVLILDVAETEPFLTAGAEIAAVETAAVISGLQIAARILGTEEVHIVVSRGFARAAHALRNALPPGVARLHMVPHRYPGNTMPALRRTCGLKPGRDDQTPAIAISPATAAAIHEAVVYRKPHIDQVIAVGGSAVPRPAHIRVRHGISVFDVLAECGGLSEEPARIVAGGTLTGRLVTNVTAPVTKGMGAIIALTAEEVRAGAEEPCIGCGACARACPVALNPMLLNHLVLDGQLEQARAAGAMDCTECGLCAHVCPSRIPLVDRIREATHE